MITKTFSPDAHPEVTSVDGQVIHWAGSFPGIPWADIQAAAGTGALDGSSAYSTVRIYSGFTSGWADLHRGIILFDTSSLLGWAIPKSAVLSLYSSSSKKDFLGCLPDVCIYSSNPASNTALVAGDFDSLGTTPLSTTIVYNDLVDFAYNDFTLNAAGLAAINVTGITKLGIRNANYDALNTEPPWTENRESLIHFACSDLGSAYKPILTISYDLVTGAILVKGTKIYYGDINNIARSFQGTATDDTGTPGTIKVKGTQLHYVDNNGDWRRELGGAAAGSGAIGKIKVKDTDLWYMDNNGDPRSITGA